MSSKDASGGTGGGREGAFVGTFVHSLDPKKRVTIPSTWRERAGDSRSLYVLPDMEERCLCVLPPAEMARRLQNMGHHSIGDRKARKFTRLLASRSDLVEWDSQGRIRVSDELLRHAGIRDSAAFVGNFRFFEIWSPDILGKSGAMDDKGIGEAVRHAGF